MTDKIKHGKIWLTVSAKVLSITRLDSIYTIELVVSGIQALLWSAMIGRQSLNTILRGSPYRTPQFIMLRLTLFHIITITLCKSAVNTINGGSDVQAHLAAPLSGLRGRKFTGHYQV